MVQLRQALLLSLFIALWEALTIVANERPTTGSLTGPDDIHLTKTHVWIYNNLGQGLDLTIHCKSKDNDLGTHVVQYQGHYEWSFRVNIIETTLFFCGLSWRDGSGVYDIYVAMRDGYRCPSQCNWIVDKEGAHGLKEGTQKDPDLLYLWEKQPK